MSVKSRLAACCHSKATNPAEVRIDVLTVIAVGLAPLGFLTVRGWTNTVLVALVVLALIGAYQRPDVYRFLWSDNRIVWLSVALASSFVASLIVHILRLDVHTEAFDGPLRPLAGVLILIHLTARKVDFVKIFQWVCPLAVILCGAEFLLAGPAPVWGGRWSNYFIDPLTYGQYTLLLGVLSLFMINLVEKDSAFAIALKLAGFAVGVVLSIGAESRSAWLALPALMLIWVVAIARLRDLRLIGGAVLLFALACVLAFLFVPVIHTRIDQAIVGLNAYLGGGNRDTSVGLRLSLVRSAWHLFLAHPLTGYNEHALPPLDTIPGISSFYTPALDYAAHNNGAHNELMQNMIRAGIFGAVSTALMFAVPFVLFWSTARSSIRRVHAAGVVGLGYICSVFFFGLATETFNLKYLATFYAIMIAALGAQSIWASDVSDSSSAPGSRPSSPGPLHV
jgi:O-antigen ligase